MDTTRAKQLLEAEHAELLLLLSGVSTKKTIGNEEDWTPTPVDLGGSDADESDRADEDEEFENRALVEEDLERRIRAITAALARIADGSYGSCTVCGEKIPEARLEANPSAITCVEHA